MKKLLLISFILFAFATAAQGQKYYSQVLLNMAQTKDFVILGYKAYGDKTTGIVTFSPEISNRDIDVQLVDCSIVRAVDDNGNTYTNNDYSILRETLPIIPKGFYTNYQMNASQCLVLPTSVSHLKEVVFSLNRESANRAGRNTVTDYDYFHTKKMRLTDVKIEWDDYSGLRAQHPAEFYFDKKHGPSEIVKGTTVTKYSGRTIIKGCPLMIHLLGAIGNQRTGDVCFLFFVYGNKDEEELCVENMTAFDENGSSYQYNDKYRNKYVKVGRKYNGVEVPFVPFKVPVGTASFQKLKMVSSYENGNEGTYMFEWNNIPIQWITSNN